MADNTLSKVEEEGAEREIVHKTNKPKKKCYGCEFGIIHQEAHMEEPHGCLYIASGLTPPSSYISDNEDDEEEEQCSPDMDDSYDESVDQGKEIELFLRDSSDSPENIWSEKYKRKADGEYIARSPPRKRAMSTEDEQELLPCQHPAFGRPSPIPEFDYTRKCNSKDTQKLQFDPQTKCSSEFVISDADDDVVTKALDDYERNQRRIQELTRSKKAKKCWREITDNMEPMQDWPPRILGCLLYPPEFLDRFRIMLFSFVNGLNERKLFDWFETIGFFREPERRKHMEHILKEIEVLPRKHDWYSYNLRRRRWEFTDGSVCNFKKKEIPKD